ncbi:hypothetical protein QTP70_021288, partial [Hemibagrus guttatus]
MQSEKAITGKEHCVPETFKASDYPNCPVRCAFVQFNDDEGFFQRHAKYLHIYNLLACLWCLHFINTMGQVTLARAFGTYYWSLSKPQNIGRSPLSKALFQMLRVVVVERVTDLLLLFGRLLVVGAIGVLAFCFFSGEIRVSTDLFQADLLNYRWLPVTLVMVGSYFIAQGCFSVYSMGVDTFTFCV